MHHRSRIVAALVLALGLGQLTIGPAPGSAACTILCPATPAPEETDSATAAPSATDTSATPTPTATTTATATPTSSTTATPTPTPTVSGPINGPDVASYQHPATAAYPGGKPINWKAVARDGMEFAIVKASESTTYKNPFFADDYQGVANAGLVRGSYHFARPAYPLAATAKAQADYFAKFLGDVNQPKTLPPSLDLEVTGGLPRADLVTWAQIFLYRLRAVTDRTPMLYTYPSFWTDVLASPGAFSRFPLWMASYCRPVPGCAPANADLWQFTSSSSISGISGGVDESRYLGTRDLDWDTLSDGTSKAPWRKAAPKPPRALQVAAGPATATVSWIPANYGSARVTSYTVTSSPGDITAKVSGESTSAVVKGLDPATTYTFTVTATSRVGTSEPSAPTEAVTPTVPTLLTMTEPASIDYGDRLVVTAALTRADTSQGIAEQPVSIWRRALGKTKWVKQGTTTTGSDGGITLRLRPKRSLELRLAFKAVSGYERDVAKGATVVHSVVTAQLSKTRVRAGRTVRMTGAVAPVIAGVQVVRQKLIGTTWHSGKIKTVRKDGTFTFKLHPRKKHRTHTYRFFVPAGHGLGAAVSPILQLRVR